MNRIEETHLNLTHPCVPLHDTAKKTCCILHAPFKNLSHLEIPILFYPFPLSVFQGLKEHLVIEFDWHLREYATLSASPSKHDFLDNQELAATSSGISPESTVVGLNFVQSCEWRRDGLSESSLLLFPLQSHRSHEAIKRVSN